ncbi:MAG: MBL fold metallo-hydrolase [Chloroflexi bacterium]|nr:MBL fold metallo-hydrolase [Chloroflexota bacterium]
MAAHKITVGNVEVVSVLDGYSVKRVPTETFPDSTMEAWREFPDILDENELIQSRYGSVVLRSQGKLIIVDTGMQTDPGGMLLDDMKAKAVDREAVDIVFLTHLHPDHVGWNLTDGRPTFPNARYLAPRSDYEYWSRPDVLANAAHVRDQVMPLNDLNLIDLVDDEYKITDEITTVSTPGHTPGHFSLIIASAGERAFILGDVAHSPAQAHYTDWNPMFDIQQDISRSTRHKVLDQLEAEGTLVSSGHFPDPGFGHFVRIEGRRVWKEL